MIKVKMVLFKEPIYLLGRSMRLYMKDGGAFYFYCNGAGVDYITGFDDQGLDLRIDVGDIDYILGG